MISEARAIRLARRLDLEVEIGISHACLSFVSFALDTGDPGEITRQVRSMTPVLWDEGLAEHAFDWVRHACELGVADASDALADLECNGRGSHMARAIVLELAALLARRTRTQMRLGRAARPMLRRAPPELN